MPAPDFSDHPTIQALDSAIEALTYLREGGTKLVPVEAEVWRDFITAPAQQAARAMPSIPTPAAAERQAAAPQAQRDTPGDRATLMADLRAQIRACATCPLAAPERLNGQGDPWHAQVAIVNGAILQGDDPTAQGSRLEGEAGALLEKMFAAIGLTPADYYLTPALKCPAHGRPTAAMLQACSEHLRRELRLVAPKAIVLLGPVAAKALYPQGVASTGKVGQWNLLEGKIPTVALHHPMRLILMGEALSIPLKRENWAALQTLRERLHA